MVDQRDWPTAISFSNGDVMKFKCFSGFGRTVYKMRSNSLPFLDFCFCPFNFLPTRNARNFFSLNYPLHEYFIFVLRQLKNTRKSVKVEWEMSDAQLLQSCRVLSTMTAFLALYSRETLMIASVSRWLNCRRSKLSGKRGNLLKRVREIVSTVVIANFSQVHRSIAYFKECTQNSLLISVLDFPTLFHLFYYIPVGSGWCAFIKLNAKQHPLMLDICSRFLNLREERRRCQWWNRCFFISVICER